MRDNVESYENALGTLELAVAFKEISVSPPPPVQKESSLDFSSGDRTNNLSTFSLATEEETECSPSQKAAELRRTNYQLQTELLCKYVSVGKLGTGDADDRALREVKATKDTIRLNLRKIARLEANSCGESLVGFVVGGLL